MCFQDCFVYNFYSLFLQRCPYCSGLYGVKCFLVIHERNAPWCVVYMDVICRRVLAPKSCLFSTLLFIYFLVQPSCYDVCEQFVDI